MTIGKFSLEKHKRLTHWFWIVLLVLATASRQIPPSQPVDLFEAVDLKTIKALSGQPFFVNPMLELDVELRGNPPQKVFIRPTLLDGITTTQSTENNKVCPLLLIAFEDQNKQMVTEVTLSQKKLTVKVFAYCRDINLPVLDNPKDITRSYPRGNLKLPETLNPRVEDQADRLAVIEKLLDSETRKQCKISELGELSTQLTIYLMYLPPSERTRLLVRYAEKGYEPPLVISRNLEKMACLLPSSSVPYTVTPTVTPSPTPTRTPALSGQTPPTPIPTSTPIPFWEQPILLPPGTPQPLWIALLIVGVLFPIFVAFAIWLCFFIVSLARNMLSSSVFRK
jgi:hypothetical protein